MKNVKKIVALLLCAVLLIGATIAGTVAYLTSTPNAVTNTFSVGQVNITLDESDVDEYGVQKTTTVTGENGQGVTKDADRVSNGIQYKLIPGHEYKKDPTVHVKNDSEACYVFVKVENGISAIEDATTIANQITNTNGWASLSGVANVYYKKWTPDDTTEGYTDLVVFSSFKLKTDAAVANYGAAEIKITAYAIQADGFTGNNEAAMAKAAWDASGFGTTNNG